MSFSWICGGEGSCKWKPDDSVVKEMVHFRVFTRLLVRLVRDASTDGQVKRMNPGRPRGLGHKTKQIL